MKSSFHCCNYSFPSCSRRHLLNFHPSYHDVYGRMWANVGHVSTKVCNLTTRTSTPSSPDKHPQDPDRIRAFATILPYGGVCEVMYSSCFEILTTHPPTTGSSHTCSPYPKPLPNRSPAYYSVQTEACHVAPPVFSSFTLMTVKSLLPFVHHRDHFECLKLMMKYRHPCLSNAREPSQGVAIEGISLT